MRYRAIMLFLILLGLGVLPGATGSIDHRASAEGVARLVIPGIASDSAPALVPTPTAVGDRQLLIRVDLDMFNGDRISRLTGLVRFDVVPAVFTSPITVPGQYSVGQGVPKSGCTWSRVDTDTEFTATIFYQGDSGPPALLVAFNWPHWQDWEVCPTDDDPRRLVAALYPVEFHAEEAMGSFREVSYYRFPVRTAPADLYITQYAKHVLLQGAHTDATVEIVFCKLGGATCH